MSYDRSSSSDAGFWFGLLMGGALGGLLGVLFAPKKGKALQKDVKILLESIPERVEDEISPDGQTRQVIDQALDKARYTIEDQVERYQARQHAKRLMDAKQRESDAMATDYAP